LSCLVFSSRFFSSLLFFFPLLKDPNRKLDFSNPYNERPFIPHSYQAPC
jgi:hypothetical protein